jgi:RHH-type proline utilization regulon transcriptional repressor/proline dehydrogenase/delta 1-pyrroline-5-carboxylate dehydrogenase
MHQTELFGPVLSLMRASHLSEAIQLANSTPYGLTAGLHSLDEREQKIWMEKIEAGNCYINRTITGAIVRRQPFGGCKASAFGGGAKAGGPNYVAQFASPTQVAMPDGKYPLKESVNQLTLLTKNSLSQSEMALWYASVSNYAYWAKRFFQDHDPSLIVGEDNILRYLPFPGLCLRLQSQDKPIDILRSLAAALTVSAPLHVSYSSPSSLPLNKSWQRFLPRMRLVEESEKEFCQRLKSKNYQRIRLLSPASEQLIQTAAHAMIYLIHSPVLANGRFELLHYLREVSLSIDYHRYGNLGLREGEPRKPIL